MIDGWNVCNQPVKNKLITYDNNRKIATGQGNYYTISCLLDYPYFKNYFTMIAVDLSNNKHLMLIQNQYRKPTWLQI